MNVLQAAQPWTPTRTLSSASQDSSTTAQTSAPPKDNGHSEGTHNSASAPAAAERTVANNLAAVNNLLEGNNLAQEPSTPEKPTGGSEEEFPGGSPIDVRGMLQRAAAEQDRGTPPVKNGAKEAVDRQATMGGADGETSDAHKGESAGESAGEAPAGSFMEATRTASEAPKDVEHLALSEAPTSQSATR